MVESTWQIKTEEIMKIGIFGDGDYTTSDGRKVSVRTGNLSRRTLYQSVVLAVLLTPFFAFIHNDWTPFGLATTALCLFLAPIIVDALKPVHTYS